MRCVDVNVLVYAHRMDSVEHQPYRGLLDDIANDDEPLGLPDATLSSFLRIVTDRRIFREPTPPADAWAAVAALVAAPASRVIRAGDRHWACFQRLAAAIDARGRDIADAYLAAYAVENGATWLSADRGFARFPGLRWRHPLD
ncbi:MAG: TA system VapC family ribonuclease toxin [Thermoleophilia bacterium]